jgi:heme exporter protein D
MTWASWGDFWAMGGYAPFVWGSYAVAVAAIAVEVWLVRQRRRRALAEIGRLGRAAVAHGNRGRQ